MNFSLFRSSRWISLCHNAPPQIRNPTYIQQKFLCNSQMKTRKDYRPHKPSMGSQLYEGGVTADNAFTSQLYWVAYPLQLG